MKKATQNLKKTKAKLTVWSSNAHWSKEKYKIYTNWYPNFGSYLKGKSDYSKFYSNKEVNIKVSMPLLEWSSIIAIIYLYFCTYSVGEEVPWSWISFGFQPYLGVADYSCLIKILHPLMSILVGRGLKVTNIAE